MLQPDVAAYILDLEYVELPTLGSPAFGLNGQRFRPAGLLDRQARRVAVSTEFPLAVQRFTGAHEIGHWMLHDDMVMHRDRPVDGSQIREARALVECEADQFAATFLMPPNLLSDLFRAQFQVRDQFIFDDQTSFHLNPLDPHALLLAEEGSLDREIALARCRSFGGRRLVPLAQQFNVSDSAMAIRIKELGLVRWP
ncbi:ImmA/IrrE family metallo-endopeptidase [Pseudomonas tohonis]|uniref:ImmA/IrrE family metallo-endopeptidase n=1 Tax=Pseudomonas tohonis TaxID=2725477 RepID=UPI0022F0450E|nr:ImmA/IrrE family metallo-endopeptidase [Pseudomonas tohonis]